MSIHRNGSATSATIRGSTSTGARLQGPGFTLDVRPSGEDGLAVEISGSAAPEQVLRTLGRGGVLAGERGELDVDIVTTQGHDRYLFTGDMRHRLLFSRSWNRDGNIGVFYGLNPIVGDTDGDPGEVPRRTTLLNVVGAMRTRGPLSRVDVLNVFTLRTASAAELPTDAASRVASPEVERDVLRNADMVMPAWGSKVRGAHGSAIADLLQLFRELGIVPVLRAKGGELLVSSGNPTHPRIGGYKAIELVEAPAEWLAGQPLPSGTSDSGVATRVASGEDLRRMGVRVPVGDPPERRSEEDPTEIHPSEPEQPANDADPSENHHDDTGAVSWREAGRLNLKNELQAAGLAPSATQDVLRIIKSWSQDARLHRSIDALRCLLQGRMPILLEKGTREASVPEVLPALIRASRGDAHRIAQSLVVGAICSGGVGEYAAFLECSEPGVHARHNNREGRYPVPGIRRPEDARLAYARLAGYSGSDDSRGTAARGDGRRLNSSSTRPPQIRYGWTGSCCV